MSCLDPLTPLAFITTETQTVHTTSALTVWMFVEVLGQLPVRPERGPAHLTAVPGEGGAVEQFRLHLVLALHVRRVLGLRHERLAAQGAVVLFVQLWRGESGYRQISGC